MSGRQQLWLALTGLLLLSVAALARGEEGRAYPAHIDRVVDGDTLVATLDLGLGLSMATTLRLLGVDTPEVFRPSSPAEKACGLKASARVKELVEGKDVDIVEYGPDKYGRRLAVVQMSDGRTLQAVLIAEGLTKEACK